MACACVCELCQIIAITQQRSTVRYWALRLLLSPWSADQRCACPLNHGRIEVCTDDNSFVLSAHFASYSVPVVRVVPRRHIPTGL